MSGNQLLAADLEQFAIVRMGWSIKTRELLAVLIFVIRFGEMSASRGANIK